MIGIVDCGIGNMGSVHNMLRKLGAEALVSSRAEVLGNVDKLILPGVGAFDRAMENLHALDLVDMLNKRVVDAGTPILGICLGMQLLGGRSEEGSLPGLGWLNAETVRFDVTGTVPQLAVPHMGWNVLTPVTSHWLLDNLGEKPRFYFVHSFHLRCVDEEDVVATTRHGEQFCSVVAKGNILGTQFHPEKSHKFGLALLENFVRS